jgi:phospholipid-binding lipoprotein MlaA
MHRTACASLLIVVCLALFGCAAPPNTKRDPRDPFERVNRVTFKFNDALDRGFAKPVAQAYRKVAPRAVRTGVSNFLDNISYPITIVNDLLQLKLKPFAQDTGRLLVNTTVGIGGIFDPASKWGLQKNEEDLGQTFGHWGFKPGPYIVIPILGPSDVRDGIGKVGDIFADPVHYIRNNYISYGLYGVYLVDLRSRLLDADKAFDSVYDRYAFLRNAYLQRRKYLVTDGEMTDKQQDDQQYEDENKILEESEGGDHPGAGDAPKSPPGAPQPRENEAPQQPTPDQPQAPPSPSQPQDQPQAL